MKNEVLLFSGATGGCGCGLGGKKAMAGRGLMYNNYRSRSPKKRKGLRGRYIRGVSGSSLGVSTGVKDILQDVKDTVYNGAIASAGALATNFVWNKIKTAIDKDGKMFGTDTMIALGKIATGIALGLLVSKLLKKPELGATLAIGPIVMGVFDLLHETLGPSFAGIPEIYPANRIPRAITRAPFSTAGTIAGVSGIPQIGPNMIPNFLPGAEALSEKSWDFQGY